MVWGNGLGEWSGGTVYGDGLGGRFTGTVYGDGLRGRSGGTVYGDGLRGRFTGTVYGEAVPSITVHALYYNKYIVDILLHLYYGTFKTFCPCFSPSSVLIGMKLSEQVHVYLL